MNVLVDTSVLVRSAEPGSAFYQQARMAVAILRGQGRTLCVVPQNLYEFWVVCTRPTDVNGLGKTAAEAAVEIAGLKSFFTFLPDTPSICAVWEQIVLANSVIGKPAHDARFVAAMQVHGITDFLTFDDADFRRFPGIILLTPGAVVAA